VQQKYSDRVNFIGVAGRDSAGAMTRFVSDQSVGAFPHIADLDLEIWKAFGITSQPSFVFINDNGTADGLIGALGFDGLVARVEDLINS